MSILVTGATGKLGSLVAKFLLKRVSPSDLILVTRKPDALSDYAKSGVQVRYADFDRPETLPDAFAGATRMLLISTISVGRRLEQHARAITAAKAAGVQHIIYTSFVGVGPTNPALVSADHYGTEEFLKSSGVAFTILRDNLYAQTASDGIAPRVLSLGYWLSSAGDGPVGWVAREDCAECAAVVLTTPGHEGKTYTLSGPELLSSRDAATLMSELSGKPLEFRIISDDELDADLARIGVPKRYIEGMRVDGMHGVATSCRDDIVTMERSMREGYLAVGTDDVLNILGRPPRSLREVMVASKDRLWPK
jgi:NAD(P)H dehydrogenase (quinone)